MVHAASIATAESGSDVELRFAEFVASHRERAIRLAWRLVGGDPAAAEDVAQEAFLRALRGIDRFREEASLSTWFYRILVRQAHSHRRWRDVRRRWHGETNEEPPDPRPEAVGDPGLRWRIARALDRLSRGQREVFVLIHMEGFTVREAAALLGRSEGTVKSHLHRALTALRDDLRDLCEADTPERSTP
jgi:RNA polymerase sigma-70 factor (ECF subfamily)